VEGESFVTRTSSLDRLLVTTTLPGFPVLAFSMAPITQELD
jgi:hypothetical protein